MTRAKKALSQAVLLISGAIMLGFGAMRGEVETVLSKARSTGKGRGRMAKQRAA